VSDELDVAARHGCVCVGFKAVCGVYVGMRYVRIVRES